MAYVRDPSQARENGLCECFSMSYGLCLVVSSAPPVLHSAVFTSLASYCSHRQVGGVLLHDRMYDVLKYPPHFPRVPTDAAGAAKLRGLAAS